MNVGEALKDIIKSRGLSISAAARIVEIPRSTLGSIIDGSSPGLERTWNVIFEKLNFNEKEKELIYEAWSDEKTHGATLKKLKDIEQENIEVKKVLEKVKKEEELIAEIEELKEKNRELEKKVAILKLLPKKELVEVLEKELIYRVLKAKKGDKIETLKEKFDEAEKLLEELRNNN